MPTLVIVAGPNGSGKTTLVRRGVLSRVLDVPAKSINADDFAKELANGGQPTDEQSLQAAQVSDARVDAEIAAGRSVMVETVLSSDKYKSRVLTAHAGGYHVVLVYVSMKTAELTIERVGVRFALGGHDVPRERILARRTRSHRMFGWFAEQADQVFVFDNSTSTPALAAFKDQDGWTLRNLGLLATDLALEISTLA